jgi:hypothetical protein
MPRGRQLTAPVGGSETETGFARAAVAVCRALAQVRQLEAKRRELEADVRALEAKREALVQREADRRRAVSQQHEELVANYRKELRATKAALDAKLAPVAPVQEEKKKK